jgi:crotonobetainyl-CoA:carnitine CoA-transferase CaiB-like acyl-CoA transferase
MNHPSTIGAPRGPLHGLKVIELAHVMAGPTCARLLADLGAEVIKVERPPHGDDARHMAPPWLGDADDEDARESAAFVMLNHNKRSIGLDLKTDAGREVLRRLLAGADVLVENFRPGALERMGFGWAALQQLNPRLVLCSISGFGQTGPYAQRGGFDLVAQAMSGLMSVTGEGPGRPPVKPGVAISDISAGLYATVGVLAALQERQRTGRGQRVETSLFEAAIGFTTWHSAIHAATGTSPGPLGSAHPLDAPYQAFEAADGWVCVGAANQSNWLKLVRALEAPTLGEDSRFADNPARMQNLPALVTALDAIFRQRPVAEWLAVLEAHGVPAGPVNDIAAMTADPQVAARGMWRELAHPVAGRTRALGCPIKFAEHPQPLPTPAPRLGEHAGQVLVELGFADNEVAAMRSSRSVF